MARFYVFPGYEDLDDEPEIRQRIYKALKDIEASIRRRMMAEEPVDSLGRALKAVNMISVKVKTPKGSPSSLESLEKIDAEIFEKLNGLLSALQSKDYDGVLQLVLDLDKLVDKRNSLFK
ncbi:MAG: hypothetical protein TU35_001945 [Thermoproteus sp. AZ2]|uniref:Uncharacterized protein n=1 Tax=Thermoproteus sp. AZ2 TaxID=1609232 RepID=A0ACC6UZH9_9CREN|nr:MAG: hypothetical protein TU35_08740 [Thermoproteus sp. AZ2]